MQVQHHGYHFKCHTLHPNRNTDSKPRCKIKVELNTHVEQQAVYSQCLINRNKSDIPLGLTSHLILLSEPGFHHQQFSHNQCDHLDRIMKISHILNFSISKIPN